MNAVRMLAGAVLALALFVPPSGPAGAAPSRASAARAEPVDAAARAAGASIYRDGILSSGAPLEGTRELPAGGGGLVTKGADAACVNCHLHSGLGSISTDRRVSIPPITGQYLFQPRNMKATDHDLPYVENVKADREPYTDASLARAIREGIDSDGKPLGTLMPRFAIGDADMAALIAYLKSLDRRSEPGVTDTVLHFATIITPDADPVKRQGMLDVLKQYFADKNSFPFGPTPHLRSSGKGIYSKSLYMANRRWQLHIWDLTGPADTWDAQLEQHLAKEPVFAVISGLGGSNWAPVHRFCEREALPCLFPNVEVPVVADRDFYSLYFSKGVLLEAGLIAKSIADPDAAQPVRSVYQIYRTGDSGEAAADALTAALQHSAVAVRSEALSARGDAPEGLAKALRKAGKDDVLVLWLRPADIAALGEEPAASATVYMSGLMGGLERAPVPAAWRGRVRMAYPFDLPDARVVRVDYPLGWFSFRHIPVVAEQVQVDTYLACGLLAETLSHSADTFVREFLVERMEELLEHRYLTGYYPRLALAEWQRFASKGGYMVRFPDAAGSRLVAAHDWTVP
jgi:hypothetical protein